MEERTKHLEFINQVITRMNSNSFLIKGWMVTLTSALFALATKEANIKFALISYIAIPAFWLLDGYYLSRERQYRSLYNEVRTKPDTDFSMDASEFDKGHNRWVPATFSNTLLVFYPLVIIITLIILSLIN